MAAPLRVLFVCTANICRSAYLELRARELAGPAPTVEFSSAGTMGFNSHPMDEVMASTLAVGTASEFRSRPLAPALLAEVDLVLTAEREHRSRILAEEPQHVRKVQTVGQFADFAAAHPELRGADLVKAAGRRRTAPRTAQDIADPYRLGEEAARAAADRIDTMLAVIVPALNVPGGD